MYSFIHLPNHWLIDSLIHSSSYLYVPLLMNEFIQIFIHPSQNQTLKHDHVVCCLNISQYHNGTKDLIRIHIWSLFIHFLKILSLPPSSCLVYPGLPPEHFPAAALERPEVAFADRLQVRRADGGPQNVPVPVEAWSVLRQREERQLPRRDTGEHPAVHLPQRGRAH